MWFQEPQPDPFRIIAPNAGTVLPEHRNALLEYMNGVPKDYLPHSVIVVPKKDWDKVRFQINPHMRTKRGFTLLDSNRMYLSDELFQEKLRDKLKMVLFHEMGHIRLHRLKRMQTEHDADVEANAILDEMRKVAQQ